MVFYPPVAGAYKKYRVIGTKAACAYLSERCKFFNPVVAEIDDVDVTVGINSHIGRAFKLSGVFTPAAEGHEKFPGGGKFLDAVIVKIRHEYIALRADGHRRGCFEPSVGPAGNVDGKRSAPPGDPGPVFGKDHDPVIVGVGNDQVASGKQGDIGGIVKVVAENPSKLKHID